MTTAPESTRDLVYDDIELYVVCRRKQWVKRGSSQNNFQLCLLVTEETNNVYGWYTFIFIQGRSLCHVVGGQQVHIFFHQKLRPMVLRLQTKDAFTLAVDEACSLDVSKVSQHTYMCWCLQLHVQHELCIFELKSWISSIFLPAICADV